MSAGENKPKFTPDQLAASEWSRNNWHEGMRIAGSDSSYTAFHAFVAGARHFQPLLAKVEGERDDAIKAHGFVWNAARKAAQYFRWAGCRDTIAIEAMNQCCEAEKLTPKWSTDWTIIPKLELESLRADLAAKEADAQGYRTALAAIKHFPACESFSYEVVGMKEVARSALASRADKGGATP